MVQSFVKNRAFWYCIYVYCLLTLTCFVEARFLFETHRFSFRFFSFWGRFCSFSRWPGGVKLEKLHKVVSSWQCITTSIIIVHCMHECLLYRSLHFSHYLRFTDSASASESIRLTLCALQWKKRQLVIVVQPLSFPSLQKKSVFFFFSQQLCLSSLFFFSPLLFLFLSLLHSPAFSSLPTAALLLPAALSK